MRATSPYVFTKVCLFRAIGWQTLYRRRTDFGMDSWRQIRAKCPIWLDRCIWRGAQRSFLKCDINTDLYPISLHCESRHTCHRPSQRRGLLVGLEGRLHTYTLPTYISRLAASYLLWRGFMLMRTLSLVVLGTIMASSFLRGWASISSYMWLYNREFSDRLEFCGAVRTGWSHRWRKIFGSQWPK